MGCVEPAIDDPDLDSAACASGPRLRCIDHLERPAAPWAVIGPVARGCGNVVIGEAVTNHILDPRTR